jgi:hypothetical protein
MKGHGVKAVCQLTRKGNTFLVIVQLSRADVRNGRDKELVAAEIMRRYPDSAIEYLGAVDEIQVL